ncbi:MAG: hypothetical protein COB04_13250 [Gammaproteobacteria bacterium]|nr:MAG: hypothetical protein COB04_13250 [Gammaproteobacteria bacterium]
MKKYAIAVLVACFPLITSAQPNIEGTPGELEAYLTGLPKLVSLSAQASKKAPVNKAVVQLGVKSESESLAEAFQANMNIRLGIRDQLKGLGIKPGDINESKFSSTPEYGYFSEKPKSYKVENILSITVVSESQMVGVASVVDARENVYFIASNAKVGDSGQIEKQLIKKALLKVKEKAALYQEQLGVVLIPVAFTESKYDAPKPRTKLRLQKSSLSSFSETQADTRTSFGESKHTMAVTVTYEISPR